MISSIGSAEIAFRRAQNPDIDHPRSCCPEPSTPKTAFEKSFSIDIAEHRRSVKTSAPVAEDQAGGDTRVARAQSRTAPCHEAISRRATQGDLKRGPPPASRTTARASSSPSRGPQGDGRKRFEIRRIGGNRLATADGPSDVIRTLTYSIHRVTSCQSNTNDASYRVRFDGVRAYGYAGIVDRPICVSTGTRPNSPPINPSPSSVIASPATKTSSESRGSSRQSVRKRGSSCLRYDIDRELGGSRAILTKPDFSNQSGDLTAAIRYSGENARPRSPR